VKIRNILAGTAVVGALAAGLAASPAANASTASAASAATADSSRHFFGPYYSDYGHGEHRSDRSYFKGFYFKSHGYYYFDSFAFDRDHDNEYTYFWIHWHDDFGSHVKYYKTFGTFHYAHKFKGSSGFDDADFRICEGDFPSDDCGSYHDVF
jgi:hypothetical protein